MMIDAWTRVVDRVSCVEKLPNDRPASVHNVYKCIRECSLLGERCRGNGCFPAVVYHTIPELYLSPTEHPPCLSDLSDARNCCFEVHLCSFTVLILCGCSVATISYPARLLGRFLAAAENALREFVPCFSASHSLCLFGPIGCTQLLFIKPRILVLCPDVMLMPCVA